MKAALFQVLLFGQRSNIFNTADKGITAQFYDKL